MGNEEKWAVGSESWAAGEMDGAETRLPRDGAGLALAVTRLQTGEQKRGWKLLIPKGRFCGGTPPRVFWQKRLDLLDSKGLGFFESAQEAAAD